MARRMRGAWADKEGASSTGGASAETCHGLPEEGASAETLNPKLIAC